MGEPAISAAEFETWLPAKDALLQVQAHTGDRIIAASQIMQRLLIGDILAVAETCFLSAAGTVRTDPQRIVAVDKNSWALINADASPANHTFWRSGNVTFERSGSYRNAMTSDVTVHLLDLRFDPKGIAKLAPLQKPKSPPEPAPVKGDTPVPPEAAKPAPRILVSIDPKDRRGPSPKDFWDDMLIAMFRRIYVEAWEPPRLADLERAMHDWLAEHGKTAGERTIRNIATKLFRALKD